MNQSKSIWSHLYRRKDRKKSPSSRVASLEVLERRHLLASDMGLATVGSDVRDVLNGAQFDVSAGPQRNHFDEANGRAGYETIDVGDYFYNGGEKVNLRRLTNQFGIVAQSKSLESGLAALGYSVTELNSNASLLNWPSIHGRPAVAVECIGQMDESPVLTPVFLDEDSGLRRILTDELLVTLEPGLSPDSFFHSQGYSSFWHVGGSPADYVVRVSITDGLDVLRAADSMRQIDGVVYATPNFVEEFEATYFPDDPLFNGQWNLRNTGQGSGTTGADANVGAAWDQATGDNIVIAIFDSGVDLDHPDLPIWTNPGEVAGNDLDDDGNGWIDDVHGINVADGDNEGLTRIKDDEGGHLNDPSPSHADDNHGTAVAGIAAARHKNEIGISGVAPDASIMSIKLFNGARFTTDAHWIEAVYYAAGRTRSGLGTWKSADVGNHSYSTPTTIDTVTTAFDWAYKSGRSGLGMANFGSSGNSASAYSWESEIILGGNWQYEWRYHKNASIASGADTAWLGGVQFPDGSVERFNGPGPNLPAGWTTNGASNWTLVQDATHALETIGNDWVARAGATPHSDSSNLRSPFINSSVNASLRYWVATDSELNGDFLELWGRHYVGLDLGPWQQLTPRHSGSKTITTAVNFPARLENVIAVGASSNLDFRSAYSQFGGSLDLVAPSNGGTRDIITTDRLDEVGYNTDTDTNDASIDLDYTDVFGGTSAAAPVAAGIAALLLSKNRQLSSEDIHQLMIRTADDIGPVAAYAPETDTSLSYKIIDDGDGGFTTTPYAWPSLSQGAAGDIRYPYSYEPGGAIARWTFSNLDPGTYQVSATWTHSNSRTTAAPYLIRDGSVERQRVLVNQENAPVGVSVNGNTYQRLGGTVTIHSDQLVVELTSLDNTGQSDFVIADAVLVERVLSPLAARTSHDEYGDGRVDAGAAVAAVRAFTVNTNVDQLDGDSTGNGTVDLDPFNTDGAQISLRAAIHEANDTGGQWTIILPAGTYTLTRFYGWEDITYGDLDVSADISIYGDGAGQTIIDANDLDRVFELIGNGRLRLEGLTVRNGTASTGGGILVGANTSLSLVNSSVENNVATGTGGGIQLQSGATATIRNSSIFQNASSTTHGGGISSAGVLSLINTTVSTNQSPTVDVGSGVPRGGGIYISGGSARIEHSTIAANTAAEGGGIYSQSSHAFIGHTLAGDNVEGDVYGTIHSLGYNVFESSVATITGTTTGNILGQDAGLEAIGFNQGTTRSHNLSQGSVAIDAGKPSLVTSLATDQRGEQRIVQKRAYGNPIIDIGAVESALLIDDSDVGFTTTDGNWFEATDTGAVDGARRAPYSYLSTTTKAVWTFNGLEPGRYQVLATWTGGETRAHNALFTILDGTVPLPTVTVDQEPAPSDRHINGRPWDNVGNAVPIHSGQLVVTLNNVLPNTQQDSFVIADAIRLERVGDLVIDSHDTGFTSVAIPSGSPVTWDWAIDLNSYNDNRKHPIASAGAATSKGVWTFPNLLPGIYQVSATWTHAANRSPDAVFHIWDGSTELPSVEVDQEIAPVGFTILNMDTNVPFQNLGTGVEIASGILKVELPNVDNPSGSNYVIADAIVIQRIGDL